MLSLVRWLGMFVVLASVACSAGRAIVGGDAQPDAIDAATDIGPICNERETLCSGRCVDTQTDRLHCGTCGNTCPSGQVCVMGRCETSCPTGQTVCAGRCVDTQTDRLHCGTCGNTCQPGQVCAMGRCTLECGPMLATCSTSDAGTSDSGSDERYCANLQTDRFNCGACGNTCPAGQICNAGRCEISCPTGQTICSGRCVDTQTDRLHCGACGNTCPAGQICVMGRCEISCPTGQTMCSGRCVDTQTDRAHCGMCNRACAAGEICMAGGCVTSCPTGQTNCSGSCRDLNTDRLHCGACGNVCPPGQLCSAGTCVVSCPPGLTDCGGSCRDLNTDRAHCGMCGRACASGQICSAGTCVTSCPMGQTACGGFCIFTSNDVNNCGGCGIVCPPRANAATTCTGGTCSFTCNAGFGDCDRVSSNGCETDLNTDSRHCGACGRACALGETCIAGTCRQVCNSRPPRVLIYGPSHYNESSYLPAGSSVTVATEAMWRSMTTAQFASYNLIVIGDKDCAGPYSVLQAVYDTRAVWGPAITGRVLVHGFDAGCHAPSNSGAATYLRVALQWLSQSGGTALYVTSDWGRRGLDFLSPLGAFRSISYDANAVTITQPSHPVMSGSTSASLSNWGNSHHSYLSMFPPSFASIAVVSGAPAQHLAVVRDVPCVVP